MAKHTAERFHDISCGHRVVGHEGKCRHLHGHNYRIHFKCEAEDKSLDNVGRVIDFTAIKEKLCMWVENNWDHKFLAWEQDRLIKGIRDSCSLVPDDAEMLLESIVWVPFNPTAENMAQYLVDVIGPQQLSGTGIALTSVKIEETAKCSATYSL